MAQLPSSFLAGNQLYDLSCHRHVWWWGIWGIVPINRLKGTKIVPFNRLKGTNIVLINLLKGTKIVPFNRLIGTKIVPFHWLKD